MRRGGGGSGGPFGPGGPFGGGGGSNTQAGDGARRQVRLTASSDDRTNTLVVMADKDVVEVVADVVKQLDSDPAETQSVFVYNLKNGQAANLEGVINSIFGASVSTPSRATGNQQNQRTQQTTFGGNSGMTGNRGGGGFGGNTGAGTSQRNTQQRTGGGGFFGGGANLSANASRTTSDLYGQVSVVANADTNSLLVMTSPKNYERVKQVLDELDRPVPQVLIKVLLAEVTHSDARDLGAEFSALNIRDSGLGSQVGTNFGVANATGGLTAKVMEANFEAAIRALETVGKLDVLSRPYILASDNQLATITVGQQVPFITNSRTTDTGQTINTIQYQDIGIILNVTPHINPEGLVILDVAPEVSALTGETVPISENLNAPVFAMRSAQSRVAIRDGQTIVIGGLMEDRNTQTVDKVPFLGDIPVVRFLFSRNQTKKEKTELLIFLTPHVASSTQRLQDISRQEENGAKLVPHSVQPGAYQEHLDAMRRGAVTQPTEPATTPPPAR
jgi:general secretion pathway protein D